MDKTRSNDKAVHRASVEAVANHHATLLRATLAATLPPLGAFAVQAYSPLMPGRWSLFYPAVFLSSWLGGYASGMSATILSTALLWWYLAPPTHSLVKHDPRLYFSIAVFIAMCLVVITLQRNLRRVTRNLAAELLSSHEMTERLQRTSDQLEAANRRLTEILGDLAESQRFLQAILDHSPNGIILKSLEGRYLIINRGLEELTGVAAAASKGKTDFDLFPRAVAERFRANDRIVHETLKPLVTEERTELKDGARVFLVSKFPLFDDHRQLFAIGAIWTDITERKRVEEALRQSASELRQAQHVAHVGSWSWDLHDRMVWSDETYRIFGRDPKLPLPIPFTPGADVFTPESTKRLRAAVEMLVAGGGPYEIELEFIRPDGTTGWVAARGENVRDADGKVTAITGTVEDITQLKELLRMREEWTSVIAHDLRQPIGFIAMASDFLPTLHGGVMNERERDLAERIRSAALSLARMVDDLLDMSLLEADRLKLERDWVDPRTIVRDTIARLSHLTPERRVKVIEEPGLVPVFVDPMRVGQVLGNLLSNAIKYGEKDSEIVVRLECHNHEIEVTVTNHGKGIEPEELPRIFSRFTRSKSTHGSGVRGLGLGLYIANGVVKAHRGRMWAESTPGDTTTFHVTLPTVADAQEAA